MPSESEWDCLCRRCNGVYSAADAVQYVWEVALGSCDVPVVVGVNAEPDGIVRCASVYWHGEPDEPSPIGDFGEYLVSCRPGQGTAPSEGDIARWIHWTKHPLRPVDWLLVDGTRFRSVAATVDALRLRTLLPDEQEIAGDWDGPPPDPSWRYRIHDEWADTVQRNRRSSRR